MGKLVISEFVSLDGVFEDPGGAGDYEHGGWSFEYDRGKEGGQFKLDEVMEAEAHLLGRITYDEFAAAWPSRAGEYADKLNGDPKYVVSHTLSDPTWNNTTVLGGDAVESVTRLRKQLDGTLLVVGSGTLARTLLAAELVDELRLMVFPTLLGRGRRLFADDSKRVKLRLASSTTIGTDGVQLQTYQRSSRSTKLA
ncbi:MAG: dihydrofolate reductase family protein [Solirubrobacterales bacterium]|nr:dihydrofolate reductase family protein [Solirubrobacterales bacterium]